MTRTRGGFGFVVSDSFELTLFVPGFAATNNLNAGAVSLRMEELEGKTAHFLAIPNPVSLNNKSGIISFSLLEVPNIFKIKPQYTGLI